MCAVGAPQMVTSDSCVVSSSEISLTQKTYSDWKCKQSWFVLPNGLIHGEFKEWSNKGKLIEQCWFQNGLLEGLYFSWYKNGQMKKMCVYINGKKEGRVKRWNKNGQPEYEYYYEGGVKTNPQSPW